MRDLVLLSERQMVRISPFFPLSHGMPRVDDRRVVSGIVGGSITYYAGLDRMEEIKEILIDRFHSGDMTDAQFREVFGQDLRPEDVKKYWEM
ncbi:hypothetical protein F8A10_17315 [Paracoccus kondratievae]|nr:hypothetical protein F8A10_17315 [Paracoccus kondratievae]